MCITTKKDVFTFTTCFNVHALLLPSTSPFFFFWPLILKRLCIVALNDATDSKQCDPNVCHVSKKSFGPKEIRAKGHCHWSQIRVCGFAPQHCNLNYQGIYLLLTTVETMILNLIIKNMPKIFAREINIILLNIERFTMSPPSPNLLTLVNFQIVPCSLGFL